MGTTTFEKGGWLIAVTGIMQTIDITINKFASWIFNVVMHIIITLKNGALVVDCCRMRMSKTMMGSIGEWRVGQTQHGAAKYIWNFVLSGTVMTEGIHLEHMIWGRQLDDLDNKQDMRGVMVIKGFYQYKWPTYYTCYYCIDTIKQYNCIARIQIYTILQHGKPEFVCKVLLYHHKNDNWSLMLFGCFWCLKFWSMSTFAWCTKTIPYM